MEIERGRVVYPGPPAECYLPVVPSYSAPHPSQHPNQNPQNPHALPQHLRPPPTHSHSSYTHTTNTRPIQTPIPSISTSRSLSSSAPSSLPTPVTPDFVAAWEEELERIAAQSQRRSEEMLGFATRGRSMGVGMVGRNAT
ncbi:hypothetical protein M422DRAFT_252445 [Sphaerobolus stellatus SS14]|uniref:Unplaced genomic scaffold SPHSTscaffold_44, whole genome shotgun sequence n=2 Tax=Sphaerobolus stellatus (strain SS14) TaxID=990650 RepID=A0A0C9VAI1_SPHS4|nr:hypothetical protein M422DRAFT_252445 [Sphaerobolus stellatus SS14]